MLNTCLPIAIHEEEILVEELIRAEVCNNNITFGKYFQSAVELCIKH